MRRTYKSKKDTGGTLDYKDMLFNIDEKSSAFDAFYIQNIKQTKREQSCMGSSNNHGAASNRVRKRKYVKRMVKDVEPVHKESLRESISGSVFLTPDKSIRVNKAPDPFDQLLNSSPACVVGIQKKKVDLYDEILVKTPKETKTYNRKKKIIKKFDYSSNESSVSDKENSNKNNNSSIKNVTNIKAHKLIIEKEAAPSPIFDESINKIVKKLTLINNINRKGSSGSLKRTFKCNKNRLTKNFQSPLVKTSPLSSTPFTDKARSKSIYKFSPILIRNLDETPQNVAEIDDNEANKSIVFVPKNISNALKKSHDEESPNTQIAYYSNKGSSNPLFSSEADTQENLMKNIKDCNVSKDKKSPENPACTQISSLSTTEMEPFLGFSEETVGKVEKSIYIVDENEYSIIISKVPKNGQKSKEFISESENTNTNIENNKNYMNNSIEYSMTPEPFLGFTRQNSSIINISVANNLLPTQPFLGFNAVTSHSESAEHVSQNNESDAGNKSVISMMHNIEENERKTDEVMKRNKIIDSDDDSDNEFDEHNYSEINFSRALNEMSAEPVPTDVTAKIDKILITSIDDRQQISQNNESHKDVNTSLSSFSSVSEQDNKSGRDKSDELQDEYNDVESSKLFSEQEDEFDEKQSLYDTCYSDTSSLDGNGRREPVITLERMDDNLFKKYYKTVSFEHFAEPKVAIERMDCDLFNKYYKNMPNCIEDEESGGELSADISECYASFDEDDSDYCISEINEQNSQCTNTDSDTSVENFSDTSSPNASAEKKDVSIEEKCVNFVTTRRKNDFTNNSEILILDDSQASTSTECDRTVLSNKKISSASPKTDCKSTDVSVNNDSILKVEEDVQADTYESKFHDTIVSNVTTRNSKLFKLNNAFKNMDVSNTPEFKNKSELVILNDSQANNSTECDIVLSNNISLATPQVDSKLTDLNTYNDSSPKIENSTKTDSNETKISNVTTRNSKLFKLSNAFERIDVSNTPDIKSGIILQPGKRWERSLSIYRRMTMNDHFDHSVLEDEEDLHTKGRKYRQSVICTMEMQEKSLLHNESIHNRRSTFVSKPSRSTIRIVKETNTSRLSLSSTAVFEELKGFLEDCDDTIVELSKLSLIDDHDVTVIEKLHESSRNTTARDYVLRRCNQSDTIPFDECYPDPLLKNCRKIGEGVYGEVFLWRAPDGRARVMKVVPIAGTVKVNGERQKDFHEIIAEIVIAMELSALRAPIADIECHFKEGKDVDTLDLHSVENATDVFNEVLAVRCVYGSYSSRLLDLWELYDETVGSENDNPAILPVDQQYIVLELANAGQDLESYQFNSAEQAYALFQQVAFALAVGEESFQFEHRDLHWGNVLIAPTDQKFATFILRGRCHRVPRRGVAATIIDYSLSRVSVNLGARDHCALYNDLAADEGLFTAVGDYQFQVYRLMRDKLGNDWKNFEPYTNILWLHYTVDKMITALRYKRTTTKTHKQYINKLKGIKERLLGYGSAAQFVLTDNELY